MKYGKMRIVLEPENDGAYTRLRLSGSVPTSVPRASAIQLVQGLSFWSGWPVTCVLSVDKEAACWCEWWTELTAGIDPSLLTLRYRLRRNGASGRL